MRNGYKNLVEKSEGKRLLGKHRLDWEVILKSLLGKYGGNMWNGCIWFRIGTSGGLLEHGNEPSGSVTGGEFLN
jgi:hypothetical protein